MEMMRSECKLGSWFNTHALKGKESRNNDKRKSVFKAKQFKVWARFLNMGIFWNNFSLLIISNVASVF